MSLLLYAVFLPIASAILLHRRSFPKPYPGIPYNSAAANRISGDLPDLLEHYKRTKEASGFSFEQCKKLKSPIIQLFLRPFSPPFICLDDPRETEDIMLRRTKEFDRAPSTIAFFKPLIPHATLVQPSNQVFKQQRRLWVDCMSPGFLRRVVAPNVYKSALELVGLWRLKTSLVDGRPFAALEDFELAAFDAIWIAILGSELGGVRSEMGALDADASSIKLPKNKNLPAPLPSAIRPDMYTAVAYLNSTVEGVMASPFPVWHHWFIRQSSQYKANSAIKDQEIRKLTKQAQDRFRRISNADNDGEKHDTCAMDLVLRREMIAAQKAGVDLPEEESPAIQDELLMLLVAGHETTATTLGWSVKHLANNSLVQSKLRQALHLTFPDTTISASPPSVTDVLSADIPYLDATIEEINRHGNTVPLLVRVATVDTDILGYRIPKGATVMCNAQFMTEPQEVKEEVRSKTCRAAEEKQGREFQTRDLEAFLPERWLTRDENGSEVFDGSALTRLAFGLGPRGCFGKQLAMQEIRIMLVLLVLNFEFLPLPEALNSPRGQQKVLRTAQQCFVKLRALYAVVDGLDLEDRI